MYPSLCRRQSIARWYAQYARQTAVPYRAGWWRIVFGPAVTEDSDEELEISAQQTAQVGYLLSVNPASDARGRR